ncbi:OLC1v1021731C1 [Oldenlandia corymbosa var. corymbosa]|uniref:OLC1v1021731C1 n=1 Tax=Oldenlandia corymbosa var. corymbosa TaxID=529605 RepID=A0AAV1BWB3_OLDCO|nr:OLC1v1021731C1 [Oldenlandia corymbosa var. corymbosa]
MEISSSLFTGPLFSTIVTICILILLYFPSLFLGIIFSPVLISTSILLLSLLRLGAIQKENRVSDVDPVPEEQTDDDCKRVSSKPSESYVSGSGSCDNHEQSQLINNDSFVGWDVTAPLEVIYEGYEGQGDESDDVSDEMGESRMANLERYASLSKFYPETDSESSLDEEFPASRGWDLSENIGFRWEREDRDGMIEIELDGKGYSDAEDEDDDNLIEIDLHPASIPATC